jgi:peptidyl-prolyl cis-trans isomerase SurA
MNKFGIRFVAPLLALALVAFCSSKAGAVVLDRIVATVNGHVILQSDWQDAVRFEAFAAADQHSQLSPADQKSVLDRLIDQELLHEQMRAGDAQLTTQQQVASRIGEIRKLYPGAETDAGWQTILQRYGFTEEDVRNRVSRTLEIMSLVDARLRPDVTIDPASITSYYNQQLLPQLQAEGAGNVPLAEVTPKIKELLTEQKISELLVSWLEDLRAGSDIHTLFNSPDSQLRNE